MKCLEKDRDRRYETANGLALDIRRYLDDEPVLACPPSAAYRLRKFVRRHKRALAMAGVVLAGLVLAVIGLAASTVSVWRAKVSERPSSERLAPTSRASRWRIASGRRTTSPVPTSCSSGARRSCAAGSGTTSSGGPGQGPAPAASRQRPVRLRRQPGRQAARHLGFRWLPLFLGPEHRAGTPPPHPRPRCDLLLRGVQPGRRAAGLRRGRGGEGLGCEDVAAASVRGSRPPGSIQGLAFGPDGRLARLRLRRALDGREDVEHLGRHDGRATVRAARAATPRPWPLLQPGREAPRHGESRIGP